MNGRPRDEHRRAGGARSGSGLGPRAPWAVAALVVVVAVAMIVGPARGWLAQRLGLESSGADASPGAETETETGDEARDEDEGATALLPVGPEVTLAFDPGVAGRRLVLESSADSRVVVRAPRAGVELVVGTDRIEFRDARAPALEYRVGVPAGLERLRIRVPGAAALVVVLDAEGGERVVEIPRGGG